MVVIFRVPIVRGGPMEYRGALIGVRPRVLRQAGFGLPGKMTKVGKGGWLLTVVHLGALGP